MRSQNPRHFSRPLNTGVRWPYNRFQSIKYKKVKLSDVAPVAEIVGALGIVMSLIFVGVQIRENTAAARAAASQAIFDSSRGFLLDIALSDELSRIRRLGEADVSSLTPDEATRFGGLVLANWTFFENVWIQ